MLKSAANPEGLPMEVFDEHAEWHDEGPLAILRRPGDTVLRQRVRAKGLPRHAGSVLALGMQAGLRTAYESIKAFSRDRFHRGPRRLMSRPLSCGESDQIVPVKDSAGENGQTHQAPKICMVHHTASQPRFKIRSTLTY